MSTFIDNPDFDDQFRRTLAAAARGSADIGEALAVADRITPADVASWAREWTTTAEAVRSEADECLNDGDPVSARRAYLRASEYSRQAFFYHRVDLADPVLQASYGAHVHAFRAALPLLACSTTVVDLETDGSVVSGYLFMPDASGRPRPTIVAPAGYDSTAEAGYSFSAVAALERDMNCLVFEGPGQGGVLYTRHQTLRPDAEAVLPPVIDWLTDREGVDPSSIVLVGRSFAGYLAPRMATVEHRVAALICDPAQYDFGAAIRARAGDAVWKRLMDDDPTLDADLEPLLADPLVRNSYEWRMTAHGVSGLTDYFRTLSEFNLVGLADRITCPTLAVAGEGDFAGTGQLRVFADALSAPVTVHEFTAAEGAGGHCEGLGQDRFDQVTYGWLVQTVDGIRAP